VTPDRHVCILLALFPGNVALSTGETTCPGVSAERCTVTVDDNDMEKGHERTIKVMCRPVVVS